MGYAVGRRRLSTLAAASVAALAFLGAGAVPAEAGAAGGPTAVASKTVSAPSACRSGVRAGRPRLLDGGRKIAGRAVAQNCGGAMLRACATLYWGLSGQGYSRNWRPRTRRCVRVRPRSKTYFSTGVVRCWPGIYYTHARLYSPLGRSVASSRSKRVRATCSRDSR